VQKAPAAILAGQRVSSSARKTSLLNDIDTDQAFQLCWFGRGFADFWSETKLSVKLGHQSQPNSDAVSETHTALPKSDSHRPSIRIWRGQEVRTSSARGLDDLASHD
jgi:hypothetical protein